MSDTFNEQISQFIDDEMPVDESDFFVRRLERDETARQRFMRYHLIGAAVRGETVEPGSVELGRRLGQVLESDSGHAERSLLGRIAAGAGIAASIALVSLVGVRLAGFAPDSAVAGETRELVEVSGDAIGIQYLMQHASFTSGANRKFLESSMLSAQDAELVQFTEALIIE
jgi:anti-sigma factor RsiW